jgi:phage terminase small subunit
MRKVKLLSDFDLDAKHALFVIEYVKDCATRRAAEAAGYSGDYGYKLLDVPEVSIAIDKILQARLEDAMIDTDWLLYEMVDNHYIARQQGNITASNKALSMVGKHKRIDAFAADKIKVSTDADVMLRLAAARKRLSSSNEDEKQDDISFM